jgi:hypothetical protein
MIPASGTTPEPSGASARRGRGAEDGHALVEVVTAVALIGVTALVTTGAVRVGVSATSTARARAAATAAAVNAHEGLLARDIDALVRQADADEDGEVLEVLEVSVAQDRVTVTTRVRWTQPPGVTPGCDGLPGEALLLDTRATAITAPRSDAEGIEVRLVATRAVPHRPGDARAAIVVRVDDAVSTAEGTSSPAPVPGAGVLLDGPLEGVRTVRLATADANGCVVVTDLARGSYRVIAAAPGHVDAWHRAAPWPLGPQAATLDPETVPSTVVSTAARLRPTVRLRLALAAVVGVEVMVPEGTLVPGGAGLRWWFDDGSPAIDVAIDELRQVAPGARDVHLGPCRAIPAAPAGWLDVGPGGTSVVGVALRTVDLPGGPLEDRTDLRVEGEVACVDGTTAVLVWDADGPWTGARLAAPSVPMTLRVVTDDGSTVAVAPLDHVATTATLVAQASGGGT